MIQLRNHLRVALCATCFAALPLYAALGLATQQGRRAPEQRAGAAKPAVQKLELRGVPNFGRVAENVYRGAQPTTEGLAELKKFGVEIVVNFRTESKEIKAERQAVEALGLRYISIPWSSTGAPADAQVAEFLELLRANPEKNIFAHCHLGSDRTGVMVAAYRMAAQSWTPQQALEEMHAYHYHHFWLPHLQKYVERFPQRLETHPELRGAPANHPTER